MILLARWLLPSAGAAMLVATLAPSPAGSAISLPEAMNPALASPVSVFVDPVVGAKHVLEHPSPDTLVVIPRESVMAVVVQTEGFASRFAPDHLIHLPEPDLTLVLDPERPREASLSGEFWVPDLVVDPPEMRSELEARLQELGLLDDDYDDMSEDDRADVRAAMLSEGQLNAAEYSTIRVESVEVREGDGDPFPWAGMVALTVRGVTVEAPFQADLQEEGDRIRIEAFARFLTSDFGIEPYRAFAGAVRNSDEIGLYLNLMAERR